MRRAPILGMVIGAIVALILVLSATFTVHQAEQALLLQLGEPRRVIGDAGLHFKLPLIQNVVLFDRRVLNLDAPSEEVPTVDQKQVIVDAFARYRIVDPLLFFQGVRDEPGVQQRLKPMISSNLRRVLGEVRLEKILSPERSMLMAQIAKAVNAEAKNFGIDVIDVRIKRVDLPEENSQAIFRRMQTQREQQARLFRAEGARDAQTLRAEADKKVVVILANARKEAEIRRGEGDGAATATYNEAYGRDPAFFDFYRSMQALTEGLHGEDTTYVGPTSGDFFRYFGSQSGRQPSAFPGGAAAGGPASAPPAGGASTGDSTTGASQPQQ